MPAERFDFPNAAGERLAALLDRPAGATRAFALFAHCFTCGKDIRAARRIAEGLTARGLAVLRFDFTGLGGSEGEFANTNFSSNVADLVAAADWLRREHKAPAILVGHSLGGAAMIAAAAKIPEARALVTIGSPAEPAHLLRDSRETIERTGEATVDIGGRPFHVKKQLLEDIESQKIAEALPRLGKALLVMHSPKDAVVGIDNASKIFLAARHPKSFVS